MAIINKTHDKAQVSGLFETKEANIALTPEMFELLSSGIYEDKILAIVRELSCNGRDAMKERALNLGVNVNTLPKMEVHAPSVFEPFFFIRDYGTGLTHQQVFDIYLTFGASTKTSSNDFIGQFGIGSKSPLAYTDSFLVTSYIDGKELQYNIYKDNGIPKITKLVERESNEPSGLKVQVAVNISDSMAFTLKIAKFFKLFDMDVEFSGDTDFDTKVFVKDSLEGCYWVTDDYDYGVYALMGGVPYELSSEITSEIKGFIAAEAIMLPFEIGELSVASSRESLSFLEGDETDLTIKKRVGVIKQKYLANIQKNVDTCTHIKDAFHMLYTKYGMTSNNWGKISFSYPSIEIRGQKLGDIVERFDNDNWRYETYIKANRGNAKSASKFYIDTLSLGFVKPDSIEADEMVILYNDKPKGGIKLAREMAHKLEKTVIFNPEPEQVEILFEIFGDIDTYSVREQYENYFPKTKRVYDKKKVSGVFIKKRFGNLGASIFQEVTELDGTECGYYVTLHRDKIIIDGNHYHKDALDFLVDHGLINEIYYIRNSAPKRCRPEDVSEITLEDIKVMVQDSISDSDKEALINSQAWDSIRYFEFPSKFTEFEEEIMVDYPTLRFFNDNQRDYEFQYPKKRKLLNALDDLHIVPDFNKEVTDRAMKVIRKHSYELDSLKTKYSVMFAANNTYAFGIQELAVMRKVVRMIVDGTFPK